MEPVTKEPSRAPDDESPRVRRVRRALTVVLVLAAGWRLAPGASMFVQGRPDLVGELTLAGEPPVAVVAAVFLPDGTVVTASDDRTLRCWDPRTGEDSADGSTARRSPTPWTGDNSCG